MLIEIERFVNWERRHSPGACTWRNYVCDLRMFVAVVGDRSPEQITFREVDRFINQQSERSLKPSTINRRLAAIQSMYSYLSMEGTELVCPVIPRRHHLREPQRLPRPLPEETLRSFFGVITHARDRAMFLLMLRCGLRISEVASLLLTDLYLEKLHPRLLIHGKGSRERIVYVSPQAENALREYLTERPCAASDFIFLSYQLDGLSTTAIHKRLMRYRQQSGVSITAHRLRHTFANDLLSARVPITSIQKLLGHHRIETTQNYVMANDHQVQEDYFAACRKLEGWTIHPGDADGPGGSAEDPGQAFSPGSIHSRPDRYIPDPEPVGGKTDRATPFDIQRHAESLPTWLVNDLEHFHEFQQRNWRAVRRVRNARRFWSTHLNIWHFLCEQRSVCQLADVTPQHILDYTDQRLKAGYAVASVNGELSALHSFLVFLRNEGCAVLQSLLRIRGLKLPDSLPRYLATEQVTLLRFHFEERVTDAKPGSRRNALLDRAMYYLLWQCGLRAGEVEELGLEDLDLTAHRISIRDSKDRRDRTVYITDTAIRVLREYLAVRGKGAGNNVFLYHNAPLKKDLVRSRIQSAGERVGVRVYPHKLRHTCGTQLLNAGCRVTSIQRFLGHKKLNTTMIYARVHNQTLAKDYFGAIG